MITSLVGTPQVLTMSGTQQTVTVATNSGLAPVKVRVATNGQPAFVNLGAAATSQSVLVPANTVEHFKFNSTSTISVLQAGTAGIVSIVAIS